jgi:hypothetical protein
MEMLPRPPQHLHRQDQPQAGDRGDKRPEKLAGISPKSFEPAVAMAAVPVHGVTLPLMFPGSGLRSCR